MHATRNTQTQFSLKSLLVLTTLCAMVCALLGAIGISPLHLVVGFVVIGGCVGAAALTIELAYRLLQLR